MTITCLIYVPREMDSLPDAIVYYILSHISNAKDVAYCSCVSKRWKETMPTVRSLFFPRNLFDNFKDGNPDAVIGKMISSVERLEGLCIYCSFSGVSLASWLSLVGPSLKSLELRMDNLSELQSDTGSPSKLDSIRAACNLESLKLWGVLMKHSPKWDTFHRLKNLEIVGARVDDMALSATLKHCPNIRQLLLLGCEGLRSVIIELPHLALCKLDFYGAGNCSLSVNCPKLENLEIQGCSWIKVRETQFLRNLSISNSSGTGTNLNAISIKFYSCVISVFYVRMLFFTCRASLYARFREACSSGDLSHEGNPVELGCYKQTASNGERSETTLHESGIHRGFRSTSAFPRG